MRDIKTLEDYHNIGWSVGTKFIGTQIPRNTLELGFWRCKQGHIFAKCYQYIQQQKTGCSTCSGWFKKTKDDYRLLAKKYDYKFRSQRIPRTTNSRTRWRHKCGAERVTSYHNLRFHPKCGSCHETL